MDPYSPWRTPDIDWQDFDPVFSADGGLLYASVWGGLFRRIIANNDVTTLNNYIAKHPRTALFQDEFYYHDSFYVAASSGAFDALRVLLDFYHANQRP